MRTSRFQAVAASAAAERVIAAQPVAHHRVGALELGHEAAEVGEVELQIGVGEQDVRHPGGADAGANRRAVAPVDQVHHEANS